MGLGGCYRRSNPSLICRLPTHTQRLVKAIFKLWLPRRNRAAIRGTLLAMTSKNKN